MGTSVSGALSVQPTRSYVRRMREDRSPFTRGCLSRRPLKYLVMKLLQRTSTRTFDSFVARISPWK